MAMAGVVAEVAVGGVWVRTSYLTPLEVTE
jgi:hypothetical protein